MDSEVEACFSVDVALGLDCHRLASHVSKTSIEGRPNPGNLRGRGAFSKPIAG